MTARPEENAAVDFTAVSSLKTDIDLYAEGKATGYLRVPHSVHRSAYGFIPIPIARIRNGDGPNVVLIGGNHGDEWEGQIALGNLIRSLEPKDIHGRLVILPSANFPAVMAATRTSPIDGGNLNRSFPGDENGSVTEQIAHWIEHALLPGFDFGVDLHSGGSSLIYIPSTLCVRDSDPQRQERLLRMMRAFGAPIGYIASAPQGGGRTLSSGGRRKGVLMIGTELGGGGLITPGSLQVAELGLKRVLADVGLLRTPMAPEPSTPTRLTELGGDDYYVYASESGVFEPLVDLGTEVEAGTPAARIHFPDSPWREPILVRFGRAGLIICKRVPARCERGDCLFHLVTDI